MMLETDLQRLRTAFRARPGLDDSNCPSPAAVFDAATGVSNQEQTTRVIEHLVGCGACAEAWQLAVAFAGDDAMQADNADPIHVARTGAGPAWRQHLAAGLAAAAAISVAVLGLSVLQPDSGVLQQDHRETAGYRNLQRALAVRLIEQPRLSRNAFELRWQGPEDAKGYRLRVLDAALRPIFDERALQATAVRIDPETFARVPSGSTLYWQVQLELEDGGTLTSNTASVQID